MKSAITFLIALLLAPLTALCGADSSLAVNPSVPAARFSPAADWFHDARLGVFMHFYPGNTNQLALVDSFDVTAVARQLKEMGAAYLIITLGQNTGFYISPNSVYDRFLKCGPGEHCSRRDLPLDLYRALQAEGIRLMLYLPCQAPNRDARAQSAFGLPVGQRDQPINQEFARKWAQVIHEWSARYGDKVAGWWFDGGYQRILFNDAIAAIYADAVKRGNPRAIVTFNPGVKLVRHTQAEDYTAGELNNPFKILPTSRWVDGSQWHALTFLGSTWGRRDLRHPTADWTQWVSAATEKGGVVTLDLGPNKNAASAPIGTFSAEQVAQFKAIHRALPAKAVRGIIKVSS
ncbi:MAG: alpha-L-fucosidase [Verrucomicrobiota bacterium]